MAQRSSSNSSEDISMRTSPSGSVSKDSKRQRMLKTTTSTNEDEKNGLDKQDRQEQGDKVESGVAKNTLQRISNLDQNLIWRLVVSANKHIDLTETSYASVPKGPDPNHVFLPYYPHKGSTDRWRAIKCAFHNLREGRVANGDELKTLILSYNGSYSSKWDFDGLLLHCSDMMPDKLYELFRTLGAMAELALDVETILPRPIPFLKRGMNASIALSKKQIACLLAHAFFCTYPMRNVDPVKDKRFMSSSDSLPLPSINFSGLFKLNMRGLKNSKLNCIFHYFKRIMSNMPDGKVVFKRQSVKDLVQWEKSKTRFTELHVTSYGKIEAEDGLLQVDFANKFVGGGVIGRGCVQEEILFLISPELIVSRLFTEVLEDNEVLIITGSEIYSQHRGYSNTFEWMGDYVDPMHSTNGVKLTQIVAMDARKFYRDEDQFEVHEIKRELNKAYSGFYSECKGKTDVRLPAVSTGNWGCGAFGGDKHLKSLIQMMAAAEAGRDVCYFTHGDKELVQKMYQVHQLIRRHNLTVGDVYHVIMNYIGRLKIHKDYYSLKFYDYILATFNFKPNDFFQPQSKGTPV